VAQPVVPEDVFRVESGRVLGALMRRFGDLDLAEDAYQDACLAALETWPRDGVPTNPGAWLTTTAHHNSSRPMMPSAGINRRRRLLRRCASR
jgi:RNA polymerase sigma-70 factor (ECF subfamily)